jgi:hypothetical protein
MESPRRRDRCAAIRKTQRQTLSGQHHRRVWRSNFFHNSALIRLGRNEIPIFEFCAASRAGKKIVIGKHYFTRQATTLLMLAKSTTDANVAAALIDKAADLNSRLDEPGVPDPTSLAPDIEPPT